MVLLCIIVLRLVCSHYLCGGSWTSSGEGGVPEKEVLCFTEGERNDCVGLSCEQCVYMYILIICVGMCVCIVCES